MKKNVATNSSPSIVDIDVDALRLLFTQSGIKNTRQRQQLYSTMAQADGPRTADQLYQTICQTDQTMNLSTIYRILETFVDKGLIEKSFTSFDNKTAYEIHIAEHKHYLICTSCKRIEPLKCCPISSYEKELAQKMNYDITGHKLEIYGICPSCARP